MEVIANALKILRQQKGVSQAEVAKAIGITRTAYVKYETGVSKPKKINELANYFEVSTDYLLGHENPMPQVKSKEKILIEGFRTLTNEGQNILLNMLNSLKDTNSLSLT